MTTRKPGIVEPSASGRGPEAEQSEHPTIRLKLALPRPERAWSSASVKADQTLLALATMTVACSSMYGNSEIGVKASMAGSGQHPAYVDGRSVRTRAAEGVEYGGELVDGVGHHTGDDSGIGVHQRFGSGQVVDAQDGDPTFALPSEWTADEEATGVVERTHRRQMSLHRFALFIDRATLQPVGTSSDVDDDVHGDLRSVQVCTDSSVHYCTEMSLTRQDWVDAAWSALQKGGPDMVAVNPLAKQLGAARSSFYWHFRDRAELLQAALGEWEKERTDATITMVLDQADPRERLRTLITMAFADPTEAGADITLTAHASDPIVGPVLERVIGRRIDFLCSCFEDLGFGAESRTRAVIAYSAFAGWLQLSYSVPDVTTAALSQDASVAVIVNKLLLPPDTG